MDLISYNLMVEKSMKILVRDIIAKTQFTGLKKDKNYYIICLFTNHKDVVIPSHLKEQHPLELTIIIQHQFLIKEVSEKKFIINLAFNGKHYDLTIPFDAISMFYDPYAEFMLKFSESNKNIDKDIIISDDKSKIGEKLVSFSEFKNSNNT